MIDIGELTLGQIREIRGLTCRPKKKKPQSASGRAIVVVDRGWIFAGDLSINDAGMLRLDNAVHVFGWESMGFAKMIENWKDAKVDLRPVAPVEMPTDSEIFRIPVPAGWGIR